MNLPEEFKALCTAIWLISCLALLIGGAAVAAYSDYHASVGGGLLMVLGALNAFCGAFAIQALWRQK